MDKIYIIDAVNWIFRSYYAIGGITNNKGESTGGLYGFIRSIKKLRKEFSRKEFPIENLVCVFDGPDNKKSRKEIYADYKIHRKKAPDDLYPQIAWAYEYCELAGIPCISVPGVEADDTIASIAKWAKEKDMEAYICTSDKDLYQMVGGSTYVLNVYKDNLVIDSEKVKELMGVEPKKILDLLAIMGDKADNIPGVEGIGPKTASALLNEFETIDGIYENIDKIKGKKQENLINDKEKAYLSKKLATLDYEIKFPQTKEFIQIKEPDNSSLVEFYKDKKFTAFLKELDIFENLAPPPITKPPSTSNNEQIDLFDNISFSKENEPSTIDTKPHFTNEEIDHIKIKEVLINDENSLEELVEILSKEREICVDTETTSLNFMEADLVGVGLCANLKEAFYIPLNGNIQKDFVIKSLKKLLENKNIGFFGHNIKYDFHVLKNCEIEIKNISFDTMLASYLLNPQTQRHGLDKLCFEIFSKKKTPITSLIGEKRKTQKSMKDVPIHDVCKYCIEDVEYTLRLKEYFEKELKNKKLESLFYDIEIPLLSVLAKMERNGIFIDEKYFENLSVDFSKTLKDLEKDIYKLAGEEFNINSPKQLSVILFEKLGLKSSSRKKGSTAANILEKLANDNPVVQKILEYRTFQKLLSTYIDALPKQINIKTKRIHATFNQVVTATGRLSSQNPNLQNIPTKTDEGKKIREGFKPQKSGWSYLAADYSQIELRLLAHLSEDPNLIKAFENGEDIHKFTAAAMFKTEEELVTKEMRSLAKAVNFGIIYGQGPYGLASQLNISNAEAKEFIEKYFERFENIPAFLEKTKKEANKTQITQTLFGRIRPIPEITNKNFSIKAAAERLAVNTPLQGTAADIIKIAMIDIEKEIISKKLEGYLILQVHDELIYEVPDKELSSFEKIVKEKMEGVFKFRAPLIVDIEIGKNWKEC
jgi:DNA polymerase I